MARPAVDLDSVVAIDVHTHAEISAVTGCGSLSPEIEAAANEYFKVTDTRRPTVDEIADYYRQRQMMAVVFTVDATTAMGVPPVPNDEIAEAAAKNSDVLIAFGSVDPHLGRRRGARGSPPRRRARRAWLQVPSQRAGVPPQRPDGLPGV